MTINIRSPRTLSRGIIFSRNVSFYDCFFRSDACFYRNNTNRSTAVDVKYFTRPARNFNVTGLRNVPAFSEHGYDIVRVIVSSLYGRGIYLRLKRPNISEYVWPAPEC